MPTFNRYLNGIIRAEHIVDDAVTKAKIDSSMPLRCEAFLFDGSSLTTGAKTLTAIDGTAKTLPSGAIIKGYYVLIETPLASSGSATLGFGHTGVAASMSAATAFDNDELVAATASWATAIAPGGALDAEKSVLCTIAGAALTAGRFLLYVEFYESITA